MHFQDDEISATPLPDNAFGYVPTPALVGPIEFTLRRDDYEAIGGHMEFIRSIESVLENREVRMTAWRQDNPWPYQP